jgi:hypothetical protein
LACRHEFITASCQFYYYDFQRDAATAAVGFHFEPTVAVGMPLLNQQRHLRYFYLTNSGIWHAIVEQTAAVGACRY